MSMPPIHPALVHLPISFVLLSVLADLAARLSKEESRRAMFRTVGFWSLAAAAIGAVLTVAAGYFDMSRVALDPDTHELVRLHLRIGWVLTISLLLLAAWRWLIWHRGQMTIGRGYLTVGFMVVGLTFFQGWYGSEMVYSHGAGVAAAGQGTESAEDAEGRLIAVRNILQPGAAAIGGAESPGGTNENVETGHEHSR